MNSYLQISTLAPAYDGNGNILAYAEAQTGLVRARYEYDPFGKKLMAEEQPTVAGRLPHQFSTKYHDAETGMSYYGFRYYSPELGRWLSRDPIGERGGINLHGICGNGPINRYDLWGSCPIDCTNANSVRDISVCGIHSGVLLERAGFYWDAECVCRCAGNSDWDD